MAAFLVSREGGDTSAVVEAMKAYEAPKHAHLTNKKPKGYDGRYTYSKLSAMGLPMELQMAFVQRRLDVDAYSTVDQVIAAINATPAPIIPTE